MVKHFRCSFSAHSKTRYTRDVQVPAIPFPFWHSLLVNQKRIFDFLAFLLLFLSCSVILGISLDWLQSLKQFFINVSFYIRVVSLTLITQSHQS